MVEVVQNVGVRNRQMVGCREESLRKNCQREEVEDVDHCYTSVAEER